MRGKHSTSARVSRELARINALPATELKAMWLEAEGSHPPKTMSTRVLRHALSFNLQAEAEGTESAAERKAWDQIAALRAKGADADAAISGSAPPPTHKALPEGTRLIRDWQGKTHEVSVLNPSGGRDHFLWNGRQYRSLSAIAKQITGTNRNGPAFFGLRDDGGSA